MRTRLLLLSAILAGSLLAACGDDGGSPTVDARPVDAPMCTPVDDSNECTTDECVNNAPVNTPRTGEACAGGGTCSATGACVVPSCTDTIMNGNETGVDCGGSCAPTNTCDTGEGCAIGADCTSGVCGTAMTCLAPACGDGVVQAGEMCDDGNMTNGDGCDDGTGGTCRATGCGNGVVTGTEVCDDGNADNGDGCDNNCTVTGCGNGVTTGPEACDDGNTAAADGCSDVCAVETGFTCTTVVPSVCTAICGDGLILGAETCDQGAGNVTPGDGCDASCQAEGGWLCTNTPSACLQLITCGAGETAVTASSSTPIAIPDNNATGITSAVTVTSTAVTTRAVVYIGDLAHTWDSDVDMYLTNGRVRIDLSTDNGGSGANYVGTLLTDAAAASITSAVAPMTGSFRPELPLARFIGQLAGGAWTLEVSDDTTGDTGTLNAWALALCTSPTAAQCGNGVADAGEECDDGNTDDTDACTSYCGLTDGCGDGNLDAGEQCDDDNIVSGDGCSSTCQLEITCGAGQTPVIVSNNTPVAIPDNDQVTGATSPVTVAQVGAVVAAQVFIGSLTHTFDADVDMYLVSPGGRRRELSTDNGSGNDNYLGTLLADTATTAVTAGAAPFTGSFRPEQSLATTAGVDFRAQNAAGTWNLRVFDDLGGDTGTLNSWTLLLCVDPAAPYCGDGATGPAEECDDGNTTNTDACSNVCTIVDGCGDGNLDAGETCDDDNIASGDGCSATCQVEPNYLCSGTPSVCVPVICGDGIIAGTETCDDGNTTASDGCSAACAVEAGFYCGSAPSLCRPTPTTVSLACTDMTGATTLNATGDDVVSAAVALPFAYTLYGTAVTHFRVSSNGYLGLVTSATGTVASAFSNTTLPTTATPNGMLAPFWDDLDLTGTGTRYLVTGAGPTQKLTIEWNALTFSTVATLVFQAQLTPDGFVEYHYCSGTGDAARASGSSATIGAENLAGTVGRAFSFNVVNSVTPGTTALRWDVH